MIYSKALDKIQKQQKELNEFWENAFPKIVYSEEQFLELEESKKLLQLDLLDLMTEVSKLEHVIYLNNQEIENLKKQLIISNNRLCIK